jgi:hypothetical protein
MTYSCLAQTPIVNETVGESIPIANLPGCNAIWSGTGPKPPCPADAVEGGILELVEPTVWYRDEPYVN